MPKGLNKVQLIGYLGATPEMRYTETGTAVTTFRLAIGRVWKDADGATHDATEWVRIVAWGQLAETCNAELDTGRRVYVEGRLQTRPWTDAQGQKRSTTEVVAHEVLRLDAPPPASPPAAEPTAPVRSPTTNGAARRARPESTTRTTPHRHAARTPARRGGTDVPFPEEDLPL